MDTNIKHTNNTHSIREPNFYDNQNQQELSNPDNKIDMKLFNNNQDPQQDFFDFEETPIPEETIPKKEKRTRFTPPPLEHIQIYFQQKSHSKTEAERFFNYYESNGWLVGGKTKMKDWKAAARNWMLNINKYANKPNTDEHSRSTSTKLKPPGHKPSTNYSEPL